MRQQPVEAGHATVPEPFHAVAERSGDERGFLGDGNVSRPRRHHGDETDASVGDGLTTMRRAAA